MEFRSEHTLTLVLIERCQYFIELKSINERMKSFVETDD